LPYGQRAAAGIFQGVLDMHDFLVALAFVAMVTCPAIVGAMPQDDLDEDVEAVPNRQEPCVASHTAGE
jgi:hypothetical protein